MKRPARSQIIQSIISALIAFLTAISTTSCVINVAPPSSINEPPVYAQ